jgi:hypothetical protein
VNRILILIFTILPLLTPLCLAGDNTSPAADPNTGIEGTIVAGPSHGGPVREGTDSTVPVANMSFEVKQGEKVITSFKTDSQGHFQVILPPGQYAIAREGGRRAIGHFGPFEAMVSKGKMTSVRWECDTGLR